MAAFASREHKTPNRRDRRAAEMSAMLRRIFEAVIEVERFPRSEIRISVTVLAADGGTRCAAVNAVSLALAHAGVPMRDLVVACAAGQR
jgi:exosome complex component RRP41